MMISSRLLKTSLQDTQHVFTLLLFVLKKAAAASYLHLVLKVNGEPKYFSPQTTRKLFNLRSPAPPQFLH